MKYIIAQIIDGKEHAYYMSGTGSAIEYHIVKSKAKRFDNTVEDGGLSSDIIHWSYQHIPDGIFKILEVEN